MPIELLQHITYGRQSIGYRNILPAYDLANLVDCYQIVPSVDRTSIAMNDGIPTLVFLKNEKGIVHFTNDTETIAIQGAWFCGQPLKRTSITLADPGDYMLVVRFKPIAFRCFEREQAIHLRLNPVCSIKALFGADAMQLLEQMHGMQHVRLKLPCIERFLRRYWAVYCKTNKFLEEAVAYIQGVEGNVGINAVAEKLGVNIKWLERSFNDHLGLRPKEFARMQRVLGVYNQLKATPSRLLDAALDCGFYDENHLIKEFKTYFGVSPSKYFKEKNSV